MFKRIINIAHHSLYGLLLVSYLDIFGQDLLVTDIKNEEITCDYLIITPEIFKENALRLAAHRNNFTLDKIENPRVVLLEDIYKEFTITDTLLKHEIIWYGLKWMYYNWKSPIRYFVFMGDDSLVFNEVDSLFYSFGKMPTYLEPVITDGSNGRGAVPIFSDDWYTTLQCEKPPYDSSELFLLTIVTGRIPCETNHQCSVYIDKVVNFDLHSSKGVWQNNVLISADDEIIGNDSNDYWFAGYADDLVYGKLKNFFIKQCYLSFFQKDVNGWHTDGKGFFFSNMNKGVLWNIYLGHGHPHCLTHENFLNTFDDTLFKNDSTPSIFFPIACNNGRFYVRSDSSMCKSFLFTPKGGALVYVASTRGTYVVQNNQFAEEILGIYNSNPSMSIGKIFTLGKIICRISRMDRYVILGDPAIVINKNNFLMINTTLLPDEIHPTSIKCTINSAPMFAGKYYCTFSALDTIYKPKTFPLQHYIRDSVFSTSTDSFNSSIDIPIPQGIDNQKVKFALFAWNDSVEAKTSIILNQVQNKIIYQKTFKNNNFSVYIINDMLIIKPSLKLAKDKITLSLFNLKGQEILNAKYSSFNKLIQIKLPYENIAKNTYIILIKTINNEIFFKSLIYF